MKIKSQKDFFAGLMFAIVGVAFAWGSTTYNVGSGARMGPGYFPLMLGIVMSVIGLIITFTALSIETPDGEKIGKWAWSRSSSSSVRTWPSAYCSAACRVSASQPWAGSQASMRLF